MMRAKLYLIRPTILRALVVITAALWIGSMPGCAAMHNSSDSSSSNGTETVPVSPEAAGVANTLSHQGGYDKDEDRTLKCEQLVRNPPGIEEIRRTPNLEIESREIRVESTGDGYRWVVYRSRGSAPDGWHSQSHLDRLHFDPTLQSLLPDKTPQYIAYAPTVAETPQDSEQMISIADTFGQKAGTFEWKGKDTSRHYTYSISKHLPCFPEPEE
jgi:hypothetical protein